MINALARTAAWLLLGAITVLSIVPASLRPVTAAPHDLEHFGIFVAAGAAFAAGYNIRIERFFLLAVAYCAVIEIMQIFLPSRHARFSDLLVDGASACAGIAVVRLFGGRSSNRT